MRRLYVGGLNHTVTQKDLKDRFGKFGEVLDVELRTRRDEEGVPYKTFAYININISDTDLKKCLTVLNKSKWKGGTLQIETAKESFLHRLAQERQEAEEHQLHKSAVKGNKQNLLDSLSKAGVENFTMKAAVPGSEVPGHKDWVVSKFGRVLPVLQLRCRKGNKARTLKYDPSKYSHNIRKLDQKETNETTSVTQLTWEVEGGDDDISKKRRGEFPSYEPIKTKKSRTDAADSLKLNTSSRSRFQQSSDRNIVVHQLTNGSDLLTNHRAPQWNGRRFSDSDVDSDEEIRRLVAAQQSSHHALQQDAEDDNLEVVGIDYLEKPGPKGDEEDYDSADTDELFESRRTPAPRLQDKPPSPTPEHVSAKSADEKKQTKGKNTPAKVSCSKPSSSLQKENPAAEIKDSSESQSDEDDGSASDSSSDFDFPALFSPNSTHLRISLADLQKLAETRAPSILGTGLKLESRLPDRPAPKEAITPDEILASILGEDSSSSDEKAEQKKKRKTEGEPSKSLQVSEETEQNGETSTTDKRAKKEDVLRDTEGESSSGSEEDEEEEEKQMSAAEDQASSSSSNEEEQAAPRPAPAPCSQSSSSEEEDVKDQAPTRLVLAAEEEEELQRKANTRRLAALQQRQKEAEEHQRLIHGALANLDAPPSTSGKHIVFSSDDEEENKTSVIQDSQSEDNASSDGEAANQIASQRAERQKPSGPQLFAGSDDDEEVDEEEDRSRFDIRPEFEGPGGQKLMALQSRFGTDERFRMDSRFLEEEEDEEEEKQTEAQKSLMDDDEALEEEKKKNLSILQSVLGSSHQSSSKSSSKAKKFRDVSALHYDPSKEEHAAFETKTDETQKESKAARRKKREEAQKLPEVSKEIYFEVTGDLKAVFGQTNDGSAEGEEERNWDQLEDEEGGGEEEQALSSLLSADPSTKSEESTGFRFSFFGDESEAGSGETTEYKAEKIQAPKVSWHQDPRFHDSSSEEEEQEEEEEEQKQSSSEAKNTEVEAHSKPDFFFFFSSDDHRLKEGPRLFCRTSQLEQQREQWEERTITLKQEYRKKHKDARRKLKTFQKS
ncbi:nucleolar protein 8 [Cyprinodon tularosa]|uniref:nucleolar protein 8 n=1 Tax=Cyprinodon tularosa TaxID=77115 RepID=UPI0018E1DBAA|nr:nucleolar protein 8 [Cyprinodon tularosa]